MVLSRCCSTLILLKHPNALVHPRSTHRFTEVFTLDANKTPRMWGARDNIPAIAKQARLAAATVLGQLAVVRSPKEAAAAAAAGACQDACLS